MLDGAITEPKKYKSSETESLSVGAITRPVQKNPHRMSLYAEWSHYCVCTG